MAAKIFIPSVHKEESIPQGVMSDEDLIFNILINSPHQQRKKMFRNLLLDRAARNKAEDMALKNYFSHTSPEGISANQNIRAIGYSLPDYYPADGNNVESLSIGGENPQDNADGWFRSSKHRPHVYGENKFYAEQQCVGIGSAINRSDGRKIFVFLSAPCP